MNKEKDFNFVVENGYFDKKLNAVKYEDAKRFIHYEDAVNCYNDRVSNGIPAYISGNAERSSFWRSSEAYKQEMRKVID